MHYKKERGFTLVEVLLIIIAVAIVGFVGFYVYNQSSNNKTASSKSTAADKPHAKAKSVPTGVTASWTPYSSKAGKFSFRYPPSWVKQVCDETALLLGPTDDTSGRCQSDGTPQVQILSTADSSRNADDSFYQLNAADFPDLKKEAVMIDGVKGTKETGTLQTSKEILIGPTNGTKVVNYFFHANSTTYLISYTQTPEFTDVLKDFELLVTETFKFSD